MYSNKSDRDFAVPFPNPGRTAAERGALRVPATDPNTVRNRLLQRLPSRELQRLMARAEPVALHPRQVLHHWNVQMREVYFIEHGLVSVSVKISRDCAVEGWMIGSEGMAGVSVLLGDAENPPHRRVVQVGGHAWRIATNDLLAAIREFDTTRALLVRYAQFVLCQISQWGACNAHHTLKERIAHWLLAACKSSNRIACPSPISLSHALLACGAPA